MMSSRSHKREKSSLYFDVLEASKSEGCVVCALLKDVVESYLANLLYENVNDGVTRSQLRQSLGFCRDHASALMNNGDPFGVAIIYQDILQSILNGLSKGDRESLTPALECPACTYQAHFARIYIELFAEYLHDKELKRALHGSDGLCLIHLAQLTAGIHENGTKNELLSVQERRLDTMRKNLSEFVRKQDIQYRNEITSPEEDASCERAIDFLVGKND